MSKNDSFLSKGFEKNRVLKATKLTKKFREEVFELLDEQVRDGIKMMRNTDRHDDEFDEPNKKYDLDREFPYLRSQWVLGGSYGEQALNFGIVWSYEEDEKTDQLKPYARVNLKHQGGGDVENTEAPKKALYKSDEVLNGSDYDDIVSLKDNFENSGGNFGILLTKFDTESLKSAFGTLQDFLLVNSEKFYLPKHK